MYASCVGSGGKTVVLCAAYSRPMAMDYGPHLRRFGVAIVESRTDLQMSREELAERSGVSLSELDAVERGAFDGLGLAQICRIAKALGLAPCDLMQRYEATFSQTGWW
jgi:DNA-binding Xre family transcriptional regulator